MLPLRAIGALPEDLPEEEIKTVESSTVAAQEEETKEPINDALTNSSITANFHSNDDKVEDNNQELAL